MRHQKRRQRIGDKRFVRALPIYESGRENADGTRPAFCINKTSNLVHGQAKLHTGFEQRDNFGRQLHCHGAPRSLAAVARCYNRPRAGANSAIHLNYAAFQTNSQVRIGTVNRQRTATAALVKLPE